MSTYEGEMRCHHEIHIASKKEKKKKNAAKTRGQESNKKRRGEKRDTNRVAIWIKIRHHSASSPSWHDPLVWDYADRYTHRGERVERDTSSSAKVLGRIGLRRLEDQRLRKARKEQGVVAAAQG